jgi:antirestriction protein ArdC
LPPWRRPWASDPAAGFPCNVVSKKKYRGINPLLLQIAAMRHGLKSKTWGTFNQWKEMGGSVRKRPDNVPPGEWGTGIIFYKSLQITEENDDGEKEAKTIYMLKTYVVFNVDQVEGEHLDHLRVGHSVINTNPIETYEEADKVIAATGADIRYGGNAAFYHRGQDFIQVPLREQFTAPEYYETVLHELCHWSEPRLDWNRKEEGYAMGELVAEMGSCFLATELGIPNADQLPNHASYLQSWLKAMQNDHRFIFQASSQASKAADYILSFSRVLEPEEVAA